MGIRETLNEKPQITTAATIGLILVAVGIIIFQMLPSRTAAAVAGAQFFTADDGKTWFAAPGDAIPPIQKDGKEAVRAYLWTPDNGKTKFVAYLERYTPEGKKKLEDLADAVKKGAPAAADPMAFDQVNGAGREVKLPNDPGAKWAKIASPEGKAITQIKPPAGTTIEQLLPWLPEDE